MIRPATSADAGAIAALWNGMIRDTLATFTTELKTTQAIHQTLNDRPGAFFVAEQAGAMLGFVTFGPFRGGPGYAATCEHSIIVAPDAQGQGAGRALMARAIEAARRMDQHIMIAAISSANPDAVEFHAKQGFDHVGHLPQVGRKSGQWLDLILMQKNLSHSAKMT